MSRAIRYTRFIPMILVISMVLSGCLSKTREVRLAQYLVSQARTTSVDSPLIGQIMDTLTEGTSWAGKTQINKRYNQNFLNVYLVDGNDYKVQTDVQLSTLFSNCYFAGSNIIFLDVAYLKAFLPLHHVSVDPTVGSLKGDQECFCYWVIGHELGHLLAGHAHGQFDSASLDAFVQTSTIDNRQELEADSFFVTAVSKRPILRISIERLLLGILNAEIEQKIGKVKTIGVGIIYDYTNQQIVKYARQPTHPEYVIRLSRMIELSARLSRDSGLYNLVQGFIKQLKETN